jgi:WS/DGAT/MGAT family acyltransferase
VRERTIHDAREMTDFEALMWSLDGDPRLSNTIGNLTIFDRSPDWDRLRARMERATAVVPRLRQHVVPAPAKLAPPTWELDPDFDLDRHLWRTSLGRRRSWRALHDLVMELMDTPFDRSRPLWEFVVIDGVPGGRAAMLQRIHHTLTDGEGGLRISEQFIDLERDATEPAAVAPPPIGADTATVLDAVARLTRRQLDAASRTLTGTAELLRSPGEVLRRGAHGVEILRSTMRQARLTESRLSPLWTQRSLEHRFDTLSIDLERTKAAAKALGTTVNDLFVAGAVWAAGTYHHELGTPVDELRVAMPVSTRRDGSAGGNLFTPTQTVLPTRGPTQVAHLREVAARLGATKAEPAIGSLESLAGTINLLPDPLLVWAGYRLSSSVDFVTSNLRAAPFAVYMAGALMEANYPIGPLAGTAFNLTTMSYRGTLWMGLVSDRAAVEEPARLLRCLRAAYRGLLAAIE